MTPYETFKTFLALKNHFHTNYDYFKYNGKVKVDGDTFDTRKDKYVFQKLSKHKEPNKFILANFVDSDCKWAGDLLLPEAETCYLNWLKRQQSMSYIFTNEIENMLPSFNDNFIVKDGQHPYLLKLYRQKKISAETILILDAILHFFNHWNKAIEDTVIWPTIYTKLVKYRGFIHHDISKFRKILRDQFITT